MHNPFLSMKNALSPLNVYDLENKNIKAELMTYADALENLYYELDNMLKECFIPTATSYGLSNRELIIGAERSDLSTQKRREMLTLRENIDSNSYTPDKIMQALTSFNLSCEIHEYPQYYQIIVDATGNYSEPERQWIRTQVERIMPAHQNVEVMFNSPSWSTLDARDLTFAQLDNEDKTFNEIDNT